MDNGGESEDGGGQLLRPAEREKFSAAGLANQRPPFSALDLFFHGQLDFPFFLLTLLFSWIYIYVSPSEVVCLSPVEILPSKTLSDSVTPCRNFEFYFFAATECASFIHNARTK